jgi:hypothetical protein
MKFWPNEADFPFPVSLLDASPRNSDQARKAADLCICERPVSGDGLVQIVPQQHADVVRLRCAVLPKPGLTGTQQQVRRPQLLY